MTSAASHPRPDDAHDDGGPVAPVPGAGREGQSGGSGPEPDRPEPEVEIESVIDPGTIRRAPRYRAFFGVGVILGLAIGLGLGGLWLTTRQAEVSFKPGVTFTVILATSVAVTTLVAGLAAVIADRRSLRR